MSIILHGVYVLTCQPRLAMAHATVESWRKADGGRFPRMAYDLAPERPGEEWGTTGRARRLTDAFAAMLRKSLRYAAGGESWWLFVEDDVEFHPHANALIESWPALEDGRCVLASLFNPSLRATERWGERPRALAADPATFLGAQALLLRRRVVPLVLEKWASVPGLTSQRLARLLGGEGPIWVHRPSLVQHIATESSWGARVQRALDFDPAWKG